VPDPEITPDPKDEAPEAEEVEVVAHSEDEEPDTHGGCVIN
jgi:hypothetical protein